MAELLKRFVFYSKVTTMADINEVLCECYQILWAGEAIHVHSQSF